MKDIVVLGAGGMAREIAFLIEEINSAVPTWKLLGFVEANGQDVGRQVGNYAVIGTDADLINMELEAVIGIGDPALVSQISSRIKDFPGLSFPNLIHPSVVMDSARIKLNEGNILCAGNVLTTDIQFGSFNILNRLCTVGHDTTIGDCNVINPSVTISGGVEIGQRCTIGAGSTILQYKTIGDDAIVGAGAVVIEDVTPGITVAGVPARPLKSSHR